jgi:hypothetical protein
MTPTMSDSPTMIAKNLNYFVKLKNGHFGHS